MPPYPYNNFYDIEHGSILIVRIMPGKMVFILERPRGLQYKCRLTSIGIPIIKIRWFHDRLIFVMVIHIHGKTVFKKKLKHGFGSVCGEPSERCLRHYYIHASVGLPPDCSTCLYSREKRAADRRAGDVVFVVLVIAFVIVIPVMWIVCTSKCNLSDCIRTVKNQDPYMEKIWICHFGFRFYRYDIKMNELKQNLRLWRI